MKSLRSALFLDFDSVFGGLLELDPNAALRFAEEPGVWLQRLSLGSPEPSRRWLVLRCYLNPGGSIADPKSAGTPLRFSGFRRRFTDAGFEIVSCPPFSHTKNAADIRIVIDALDALQVQPRYDEFVIVSGDSDIAPLVFRLRALDRRVTVVSPSDAAGMVAASADQLITGDELLRLFRPQAFEAEAKFRELVLARYMSAPTPINLSALAIELNDELGSVVEESRWFGHGHIATAVQALGLSDLRTSQQFMWDQSRHTAPGTTALREIAVEPTESIKRVQRALKIPALPTEAWLSIYDILAAFASSHEFSISEATQWSHDQLASKAVDVSRQIIGMILRGAASGGCPLYRQPPPRADEIANAFVRNVTDRANAVGLNLSAAETQEIRYWLAH